MALELVSSTVLKDANNAYLDGWIVLEFNQDIDPATVNNTTVQLYILPSYNLFSIKREVFEPRKIRVKADPTILIRNSSYELVIISGSGGVKSTSGDTLSSNKIVPFSTKELLAPTEPPTPPEEVVQKYSNVQQQIGDNVAILVPDTEIQGEIQPFRPCPPGGFQEEEQNYEYVSGVPVPVEGVGLLKVINSDPPPYSIGVTDLTTIVVYWNEPIVIVNPIKMLELSYENLNFPFNPFTKTVVPIDNVSVLGNEMIIEVLPENLPTDYTNIEFTLVIKPLKISSVDGKRRNTLERINWLGRLDPLLCTIDMAKANAGLWMEEFTSKDIYYYTKAMYMHSVTVLRGNGYTSVAQVPPDELASMSKYVCCSTALDMLSKGTEETGSGLMGGRGSLFVKRRSHPGVTIEYGLVNNGSGEDEVGDPAKEAMKRLMECIKTHKPKDERVMETGPIGIDIGVKSLYDKSGSIPRRRRL